MKIVKRKNVKELHLNPIEIDEIVFLEEENICLHLVKSNNAYCNDDCYLQDNCPHTWDGVGCRFFYHFEKLNEIEILILNDKE
jgi:hypothetical protein